jgi:hypothetical protein
MPFDEEDDDVPSIQSQKLGLKNVSSQKSIFDSMPKKPTQEEFEQKVKTVQEKVSANKVKAADLAVNFGKILSDKTLPQNKNPFQKELEKEVVAQMVQWAVDVNNDPNEQYDGMGSMAWITLLLKVAISQRDKINQLEYLVSLLEKKSNSTALTDLVSKEIAKALDSRKKGE